MVQTMDQMIAAEKALRAENEALKAKLAAGAQFQREIGVSISDFGKGTISITGVNRFPIALYPSQIGALTEFINSAKFQSFVSNPETLNKLRCAAFAHEWATKLGFAWPSGANKTDVRAVQYQESYNQGYALAKADGTLVASPRVKAAKKDNVAR